MSDNTDVLIEPTSISVLPGETSQTTVTVKNSGETVDQFSFRIDGLDPEWYNIPVSSTTLFPNDEEKLRITFHPPKIAEVNPGFYNYHLIIDCRENPDRTEVIPLILEVKDIPEFQLELAPEQATGNKGLYKIIVSNKSDSVSTFQLHLTTHDPVLQCNLQPAQLSVQGNGIAESTLKVKLRWSYFLHRKRQYDFTIDVRQMDSNRVKTVSGKLIRRPRQIRFPFKLVKLPVVHRHARLPAIARFEAITENNETYYLSWTTEKARDVRLDSIKVGLQGNAQVFPIGPANYVLTASNKHGTVDQTVFIEPAPVPRERISDRILALMEPDILEVAAGSGQTEATLEIQNAGSIVDKFSVEIEGLSPKWYSISEPVIALMPHTKGTTSIYFHPPKVSGVKSGTYPFAVTLRSQSIPDDSASIVGRLKILPSVDYGISVKPYRIMCHRNCTFQISINNRDVSDAALFISVSDIENGLRFRIKNDSPIIRPWQTVEVPMVAIPRRNSIIGDIKRYDISVTANTAEGNTQLARCQMDHKPFLSSWRPILRSLKYIILIGIAGVVVYYVIGMGGGWGSMVRDPQSWVNGIIRHFKGLFY